MKALVLLSGGLDSAVTLALAVKDYGSDNVIALSVYYGQKHKKELLCAQKLSNYYHIKRIELDLSPIFYDKNCSLLGVSDLSIPHDLYSDLHKESEKPISTYVPFRNGLFLSVAASIALEEGCKAIYYGIHADEGPESAYPDTSLAFHQAIAKAIEEGSGHLVKLIAPFVEEKKSEVVRKGIELNVPFQFTWSCYEEGEVPCGKCPTCLDRAKAFAENGMKDPALE